MTITIYCDGGVHNKRLAIVDLSANGRIIVWENVNARFGTSNELEELALLKAIEYVYNEYGTDAENVTIYGDAVSSDLYRTLKASSDKPSFKRLVQLQKKRLRLLSRFRNHIEGKWIPRKKNLAGQVLEMMYNMDVRLKYRGAKKTIWQIMNC